jgi:LysM repeat protein
MTFNSKMARTRYFHGIAAALMLCVSFSHSHAADPKPKAVTSKDIDALRQSIEDQSKQIEALTQEIAHLTEVLAAHGISVGATSTTTPAPSPENTAPAMAGTIQPSPDNQGSHTVTKGETLTSIAKHYKITVGELEKVNKIENDRTLQIGQILIIPAATPSATPEDKKENQ